MNNNKFSNIVLKYTLIDIFLINRRRDDNFEYRHVLIIFSVFVSSDWLSWGVSLYSLWRKSVSSVFCRSDFYNSGVNTTTNTILHFDVELGHNVKLESSILLKILLGWSINNISDGKSFDGFVFGTTSATIDTNNRLDVSSVIFVSSLISSLLGHDVLWLINKNLFILK